MSTFSLNSRTALAFLALIVVSILFALSRMPGGIGGTGITGSPGGIGGTGIYGRIDAFGSIWVNGVEIFYDEDQNVIRQGRDGLPDRLAIGQIVAVTINEETGRAEAQTIEIVEEVNGPIEQLEPDQFEILGQRVILTDETLIEDELIAGNQVAVNGLRAEDGTIVASRIVAPLIEGELSLRGEVDRVEGDSFWVGNQEIRIADQQITVGYEVEIRGRIDGADLEHPIFIPQDVEIAPDTLFGAAIIKRNYQTIVERQAALNLDNIKLDAVEIENYNIAVKETEFSLNDENQRTLARDDIVDLKPLSRNILQKRRIDVRAVRENVERLREQMLESGIEGTITIQAIEDAPVPPNVMEFMERLSEADSEDQDIQPRPQPEALQQPRRFVDPIRQPLIDQRRREQIQARRAELQQKWMQDANVRRVTAVEARRIAIQRAREAATQDVRTQAQAAFTPQEVQQMIRSGNIDRATFDLIQRDVREGVRRDLREGTRDQLREEVRKRIRDEIRRRVRRQLRDQ